MVKFLIRLGFFIILLSGILVLFLGLIDGKKIDDNYRKIRLSRNNSFVFGSSRASQGIVPNIIHSGMTNFAFTNVNSPYGEIYYRAIEKMIYGDKGLFIMEVNPFNLGIDSIKERDTLRESDLTLDIFEFNMPLKGERYLVKLAPKPLYKYLFLPEKPHLGVHPNGWFEVFNNSPDSVSREIHKKKVSQYRKVAEAYGISEYRVNWLKKTIDLLKENGEVVLVRLPTSEDMQNLEDEFYPEFSGSIQTLANELKIRFLDFSHEFEDYHSHDGNHLESRSAKKLSRQLKTALNN